jgi:hypothetical protein
MSEFLIIAHTVGLWGIRRMNVKSEESAYRLWTMMPMSCGAVPSRNLSIGVTLYPRLGIQQQNAALASLASAVRSPANALDRVKAMKQTKGALLLKMYEHAQIQLVIRCPLLGMTLFLV